MGTYVVLARKWRSAQFKDIVGQGHIVRTLMNSIRTDRIHHAYLFCGSRGIGKTSIARIFSKAIRCEARSEKDGWLYSCDQCASCKEITQTHSVDVIEIDGASNNGVDAIREIRENAKFLPASGQKKIYIIDEVHMLTTAAFNALLKTLEEPPEHVLFIFATTESHKIPATILSRCQRYDFGRVSVSQIHPHLKNITQQEGIEAEPSALTLIAKSAEGSMRDALSLLDQVIAYSGKKVTELSVRESLGLIAQTQVLEILRGVLERDSKKALHQVEQVYQGGQDLRTLARALLESIHALLLIRVGASDQELQERSAEERKELDALAPLRPIEELELLFQVIHHGIESLARSPHPKIILDILLIKCAEAEGLSPVPTQDLHPRSSTSLAAPALPAPTNPPAPVKNTTTAVATPPTSEPKAKTIEGLIALIRKTRPFLASVLEYAGDIVLPTGPGESLLLRFREEDSHKKDQLSGRDYTKQLQQSAETYFGFPVMIQLESVRLAKVESIAVKKEKDRQSRESKAREALESHPLVREARSLFGGEFSKIELKGVSD